MKENFENMPNGGNANILERILEVIVRSYKNLTIIKPRNIY